MASRQQFPQAIILSIDPCGHDPAHGEPATVRALLGPDPFEAERLDPSRMVREFDIGNREFDIGNLSVT
jgi:hypothetical protein